MKNQEIHYVTKIELQESFVIFGQQVGQNIQEDILPALKKEILEEVGVMLTEVMNVMGQSFQRLEERFDRKFDSLTARLDGLSDELQDVKRELATVKKDVGAAKLDIVALDAQTQYLNSTVEEVHISQSHLAKNFARFLKTRALGSSV